MRLFALMLAVSAIAAEPSGRVELSPSLNAWKAELTATGRMVFLARIYLIDGQWTLPADTEQRRAFAHIAEDPSMAKQLANAHAMTVNLEGYGRRASFIFLNMARHSEWRGFEDAIIAHEFGHVYLHVRGYRSPGVGPGTPVCEAAHVGDMVQHILIRQEMKRRGIDYVPWMAGTLEPVVERLRKPGPSPNSYCDQLARLSMWLDASLGLTAEDWPQLPEFLSLMQRSFPELESIEANLRDGLAALDVSGPAGYEAGLKLASAAAAATSSL